MNPKYTIIELLRDKWWIAVLALLVSMTATPVVRWLAYRKGIVDRPDDLLKPHKRPVAYLGGVAICVGLLSGLLGYALSMHHLSREWHELAVALGNCDVRKLMANPIWNVGGIALASLAITLVGLWDDLRNLRPWRKIVGQCVAGGFLLAGGVGIKMVTAFLFVLGLHASLYVVVPASVFLCLLIIIASCNATNLLDGLDGLCGGVTGIIAIGFLALALFLAVWGWEGHECVDNLRVGLCLAMAGAVLGFLPYNIPPASIFMGDAGSMLLGFFVATMMVLFCQEQEKANARWFLAACMVFALPILDTTLAVLRRAIGGVSIFSGDRSHFYDQLVDRGLSVKQVVALFYALAALAAGAGVVVAVFVRMRYALIIYAVVLIGAFGTFHALGMIVPRSKRK